MYKGTTWMIALLLAMSSTGVWAQQTDMTQNIPYTDTPPVLDGQLDDHYPTEGDGTFPMLNGRSGYPETGPDPFDLAGTAYAMWDENFLYVIVIVQDDILIADAPNGNDAWQDDSIELYIDGDNAKCQSCYDDNDAQYRFRPGNPETGEPPLLHNDVAAGIEWTNSLPDEGGYIVEMAIPWTMNGVVAQTNTVIGFDVHINDDDEGGATRSGKLHWSDSPGDNQYQYADYFGTAVLVGGGGPSQAVAQIRRTPASGVRVGAEVQFDGSTSTAPGQITSYEWDLGDGTTASGAIVTHTYDAEGTYNVTLTVTDDGGIDGTTTTELKVYSNVGTADNPLQIPMTETPPTIDGVMDDVYADAQVVSVKNRANGTLPSHENDLTVTAYLLWDVDNLYVLYDVIDDTLSNDSGNSWEDDTPELYIDGGNEKNGVDPGYDENDLQYEFGWGATAPTGNSAGNAEGVEYATVDKDDGLGYILEAVVPWARASVTAEEGVIIGLELMINDDDSDDTVIGGRQTKLSWFAPDGQDVAYQDPSAFGTAILVASLPSSVEQGRELPGGFAIHSIYPNPFNPTATALLNVEQPGEYTLVVYNVLGQEVHKQHLTAQAPGDLQVTFDLRNQASGIYLFSMKSMTTGAVSNARATLLK